MIGNATRWADNGKCSFRLLLGLSYHVAQSLPRTIGTDLGGGGGMLAEGEELLSSLAPEGLNAEKLPDVKPERYHLELK